MRLYPKSQKIYHIGRSETDTITEGGVSRDLAFSRALNTKAIRIQVGRGRLKNIYNVFKFLLFPPKNSKVIIHYPNIGVPISDRAVIGKLIRRGYVGLLKRMSKANEVCVDVADIPCEQAVDLGLPIPRYYDEIELSIFSAATVLMPASESMKKLILLKHPQLHDKKFIVCNNGAERYPYSDGNKRIDECNVEAIKFVYAGTLNKGRSIETLLSLFSGSKNALYLLGADGGWLPEKIQGLTNVFYLGALTEQEAFRVVSECDVGLIPYDSNRPYYNVAYPTKLSFYAAAGVPYLSTPVVEALAVQQRYQCGWICQIDEWKNFIETLDVKKLESTKQISLQVRDCFDWVGTLKPFMDYLEHDIP